MEKVRAKFHCNSVENFSDSQKVNLHAVCGDSEEDKKFNKYTPNGNVSMTITNDTQANGFFVPGKSYYLDFTKA